MSLPKIIIPKQPRSDIHQHCNDTFRELVKLWSRKGYCRVELSDNPYVWWNQIGDVLLYDRPTLEFLSKEVNYRLGLFGNPPLLENGKENRHWIFWPRRPELVERKLRKTKILDYRERTIESIFLGKVENQVQYQYRAINASDWMKVVELFEMPIRGEYKYSQSEYLDLVAKSKFGLCLRGYGPKCNREIELLAFGTVPLITPEVDTQGYYEPLVEGEHYLLIKNPADLKRVIQECSEEKWRELSKNGREWYNRNCSVEGSFSITKQIIISHVF